jgi:short-subunit dehydrogenase
LINTNVKVSVVFPGAIGTNIMKNSGVDNPVQSAPGNNSMKSLLPAKAAQIIINGMESNRYRVLVGTDAKIMDIFYRITPRSAAKLIGKKMATLLSERVDEKQLSLVSRV